MSLLTIPDAAKQIGWGEKRMRRLLKRMNVEMQGRLLTNTSKGKPHYLVSEESLRAVLLKRAERQLDHEIETERRLDALEGRVGNVEDLLEVTVESQARVVKMVSTIPPK
jgi:molybdenum-dependent DNA-binding transcriptional regulator ModE